MGSKIHEGHRERMRQRFREEGPDGFADHELLEVLLYGVIPRGDTNEIAHRLLTEFGSFTNLLEADPHELGKTPGLGEKSALFFSMLHELIRRYEKEKLSPKSALLSIFHAVEYCRSLLEYCTTERFYAIYLDGKRSILHTAKVGDGSVGRVYVQPRMVLERALRYQATGVLLCHNHPRGAVRPSNADLELTMQLKGLLEPLEIDIVDHIIIGKGEYYSFFEQGML